MTSTRPPLLGQGIASAALAALLLGLATAGEYPLLAGVALVQVLTVLGFLALVEAPASGGVFLLALAAAVAADVVVVVDDGNAGGLAGVVALSVVAGLLHQLSRTERSRVTESLADAFVAVVLVCSAVCVLAALQRDDLPVRAALAAAGAALVTGRLGDRLVGRPSLALGSTRAWPGLLLGLGAGVAACVAVIGDELSRSDAALVGLLAVGAVAATDLAMDLAGAELTPDPLDARRVAALRPVSTVLPFALLGPAVLLAVELLERT